MAKQSQNPELGATQLDPRVESLAIPLAVDYAQQNYKKLEDGTYEPAWRGVNGEKELKGKSPEQVAAWLVEEQGYTNEAARSIAETMVIDIANTPFNEYSEHWKEANRGAARDLIALVDAFTQEYQDADGNVINVSGAEVIMSLELDDSATIEYFGAIIHNDWLARTPWMANEEIKNNNGEYYEDYEGVKYGDDFDKLPPAEQAKDIDQLRILQQWAIEQQVN